MLISQVEEGRSIQPSTTNQQSMRVIPKPRQAAGEEALPMLTEELLRALEDVGGRAPGAASLVAGYCRAAGGDKREALQDHVDALMTVRGWGWGWG